MLLICLFFLILCSHRCCCFFCFFFYIWKGYALSGEIALKNNHYIIIIIIILVTQLRSSFLDTEIDVSNHGCIDVLCPWARYLIRIASVDSDVKSVLGGITLVKGVCSLLWALQRKYHLKIDKLLPYLIRISVLIMFCLFDHYYGHHTIWCFSGFKWTFPALTGIASLAYFSHNCVITITSNQQNPENNVGVAVIFLLTCCRCCLCHILLL